MSLVTNLDNIFKKGVIGNVRKAQEDSHDMALKTPNGDVFVVCDGMGGHVGGAKASQIAVDSIISHLKKEFYRNPIEALNGALQFANMQILGYASEHPELQGMGTTACILLLRDSDVWIAHVGDSRIYLYLGKERQLHRITKDHSYVQTLVDQGQISDEEAEHHPNKNRILKALGIKPELQPSFNYQNSPIHPKNGDIFLICSDGLSGEICDLTIEKVLGENSPVNQKGEKLIALAMQGENGIPGGKDNCTLELIKVDSSPWKKSRFMSCNPKERQYPSNSGGTRKLIILISAAIAVAVAAVAATLILSRTDFELRKLEKQVEKDSMAYFEAYSKYTTKCNRISSPTCDSLKEIMEKAKKEYSDSKEKLKTYIDSIDSKNKNSKDKNGQGVSVSDKKNNQGRNGEKPANDEATNVQQQKEFKEQLKKLEKKSKALLQLNDLWKLGVENNQNNKTENVRIMNAAIGKFKNEKPEGRKKMLEDLDDKLQKI